MTTVETNPYGIIYPNKTGVVSGHPEGEWPGVPTPKDPARRCKAHGKSSGKQCRRPAIHGGTVCKKHGGAAPHVQAAAKVRLDMAAEKAAQELIGMAIDQSGYLFLKRPDVKLAAINSLLDRAGLKPTDKVEVTNNDKPYEKLVEALGAQAELTREQSRALRRQLAESIQDAEEVPIPDSSEQ